MAPKKDMFANSTSGTFESAMQKVNEKKELSNIQEILISDIKNPVFHDRSIYSEASIIELQNSITELAKKKSGIFGSGLLSPVIVRKLSDGSLERISGYRRIKAFQNLKREQIPAIILDTTDKESQLIMIIENMQRENLCVYDEVLSLLTLIATSLDLTVEKVKSQLYRFKNQRLGNVQSMSSEEMEVYEQIQNILKSTGKVDYKIGTLISKLSVLNLNDMLINALKEGLIEERVAMTIHKLGDNEKAIKEVLEKAINENLTVKNVKILVDQILGKVTTASPYQKVFDKMKNVNKLPQEKIDRVQQLMTELDSILDDVPTRSKKKQSQA
jgi:ParB family chromosome partitioning protein